jgi:hypothetical protein
MDPTTVAIRTSGAVGFGAAWLAAPTLSDRIGDKGLFAAQMTAAGVSLAGAAVEFTHHGLSGFVTERWTVDGAERVTKGWHYLGLGSQTRLAGLSLAAGAAGVLVGIGFGSARGDDRRG